MTHIALPYFEIATLIQERSAGRLSFQASSLYPVLFRMEKRGWIKGTWVEKEFTLAVNLVVEPSHA